MLRDVLQRYQQCKPDLQIRQLAADDSVTAQQLLQQFPDITTPCVVMTHHPPGKSTERHEILKVHDLVEFHGSAEGTISGADFFAEQAITAALSRLSSGRPQAIVYCLTGHGELSLEDEAPESTHSMSELAKLFRLADIELRLLDLTGGATIPTDADAVILAGPQSALAADDVAKLETYFKHGGSGLLLFDLVQDHRRHTARATGMEELLSRYGLLLGNDYVVTATAGGELTTTCPAVAAGGDSALLRSLPRTKLELQQCRSVRQLPGSARRQFHCTPLLLSPPAPRSWAEGDLDHATFPAAGGKHDLAGPVSLATAVERTDRASAEPMLIVVGDAEFASNRGLTGNRHESAQHFLVTTMNWLTGRRQRFSDIPVSRRRPYELAGNPQSHRGLVWKSVLFLSALITTTGTTVWSMRRSG